MAELLPNNNVAEWVVANGHESVISGGDKQNWNWREGGS